MKDKKVTWSFLPFFVNVILNFSTMIHKLLMNELVESCKDLQRLELSLPT